jgi:hypothetical protein
VWQRSLSIPPQDHQTLAIGLTPPEIAPPPDLPCCNRDLDHGIRPEAALLGQA